MNELKYFGVEAELTSYPRG